MSVEPKILLRKELQKLQAYHVPNTEGFIKLDAMENPYAFPAELKQQWLQVMQQVSLNRYPDPQAEALKQVLRQAFNLNDKFGLMLGNGSDELIQLLVLAIAKPGACVLTVTPSFSMYKLIAEFIGVRVIEIPLQAETFDLQTEQICKSIKENNPALLFLACPNNPTGTLWPQSEVEEIVRQSNGLVVLDEAYAPFADYSMMELVEKYSHVLLLRTVSKMGLAGLRLGWLYGAQQWLNELNKLRLPYNINVLTQASAEFALQNIAVFNQQAARICQQREMLISALQNIDAIKVYPSQANFVLIKTLTKNADEVFQFLIENKIMIKNISAQALLENCLRVTVGTDAENEAFLKALVKATA